MDTQTTAAIALIVIGTLLTFGGGKWFQFLLFAMAAIGGGCLAQFVTQTVELNNATLAMIGVVAGALVLSLYRGSVFTLGGAAGLIGGELLWHLVIENVPNSFLTESPELYNGCFVIGSALIGGYLAFQAMEAVLKVLTTFIGSFCVTSAVAFLVSEYVVENTEINILSLAEFFKADLDLTALDSSSCGNQCTASLAFWICLFSSGVMFQYGCGRTVKKKTVADEKMTTAATAFWGQTTSHKRLFRSIPADVQLILERVKRMEVTENGIRTLHLRAAELAKQTGAAVLVCTMNLDTIGTTEEGVTVFFSDSLQAAGPEECGNIKKSVDVIMRNIQENNPAPWLKEQSQKLNKARLQVEKLKAEVARLREEANGRTTAQPLTVRI